MTPCPAIHIEIVTRYIAPQSAPEDGRYAFAYTITLRNDGQQATQLLSRHWIITDANGRGEEVRGDGVVGEQPTLAPGGTFRYSSGAVLETPVGTMQGSYHFQAADGRSHEVPIPVFRLALPGLLH